MKGHKCNVQILFFFLLCPPCLSSPLYLCPLFFFLSVTSCSLISKSVFSCLSAQPSPHFFLLSGTNGYMGLKILLTLQSYWCICIQFFFSFLSIYLPPLLSSSPPLASFFTPLLLLFPVFTSSLDKSLFSKTTATVLSRIFDLRLSYSNAFRRLSCSFSLTRIFYAMQTNAMALEYRECIGVLCLPVQWLHQGEISSDSSSRHRENMRIAVH